MTNEQIAMECIARLGERDQLLRRRDQALAAMYLHDGLTQAEVARRTGLSEGTVRLAVKLHGTQLRAGLQRAG